MEPKKKLEALLVRPMCLPRPVTLDGSLESLQQAVGGMVECVYPFEEPVALLCNEEGKLLGLPPNRALRDDRGQIYDIICGNFLVVGLEEERFRSLTAGEMAHFKDLYSREIILFRPPDHGRGR